MADLRSLRALCSLNFFMADIQAGIGPFLGVFLLAHGWDAGWIGTVMTIGGIAGVLMTAPAGSLIDSTESKRAWVIAAGFAAVLGSAVILISQSFLVVAASQVATAAASALIGPALAGLTLGIVKQAGFNRQNGRNQAFNHAGNAVGAGLSGFLGWKFGFTAVFGLAALFGLAAIASTLLIRPSSVDHAAARGAGSDAPASGLGVLWRKRPILVLAGALGCFHLGNAAMLPLYGMALTQRAHAGNGAGEVALTIVVAQAAMVLMSLLASRLIEARGYWIVLMISFLALPLRGLVAALWIGPVGVYPVQILDGVGAGLQSVAVPGLAARLLNGTGRVNVGQGALLTVQGLGAALSPAVGGWLVRGFGYPVTFVVLGAISIGALGLWALYQE